MFCHTKKSQFDTHTNRPHFTESQNSGVQKGPLEIIYCKPLTQSRVGQSGLLRTLSSLCLVHCSTSPYRISAWKSLWWDGFTISQCWSSIGLCVCCSPLSGISGKKGLNIHGGGEWERLIKHSQVSHFSGLSWQYSLENAQWDHLRRTDFIALIIGGLTMTL